MAAPKGAKTRKISPRSKAKRQKPVGQKNQALSEGMMGNQNALGNPGGGQESPYRPEMAEEARLLCAEYAATDLALAEHFGVDERTINKWKTRHVEFRAAIRAGKDIADDFVELKTLQHIGGYFVMTEKPTQTGVHGKVTVREWVKGDPSAGLKWLACRRPEIFRQETKVVLSSDALFLDALKKMNERVLLAKLPERMMIDAKAVDVPSE